MRPALRIILDAFAGSVHSAAEGGKLVWKVSGYMDLCKGSVAASWQRSFDFWKCCWFWVPEVHVFWSWGNIVWFLNGKNLSVIQSECSRFKVRNLAHVFGKLDYKKDKGLIGKIGKCGILWPDFLIVKIEVLYKASVSFESREFGLRFW